MYLKHVRGPSKELWANLRLSSELGLPWGPENTAVGSREMVCPESDPHRTLKSVTSVRNLNRCPEAWEKPLVQACIWSPTRGFLQVRNLTDAVSVGELSSSAQALLIPREFTPEDVLNALSVNRALDSMHVTLDVRKPTMGRNPSKCVKGFLRLSYSSEKPYWWKRVYLSWMWQKHELESRLGFAPKKPNLRKDLTGSLSEKNFCQWTALVVHRGTHISEKPPWVWKKPC